MLKRGCGPANVLEHLVAHDGVVTRVRYLRHLADIADPRRDVVVTWCDVDRFVARRRLENDSTPSAAARAGIEDQSPTVRAMIGCATVQRAYVVPDSMRPCQSAGVGVGIKECLSTALEPAEDMLVLRRQLGW